MTVASAVNWSVSALWLAGRQRVTPYTTVDCSV